MIIKNWVFEWIALTLLAIFVITGLLIVRRIVRINSMAVLNTQGINDLPEKGSTDSPEPLERLKTINLGRIDVRLCPECKQGTMVKTGNKFKCGECKAEYDWNEL